MIHRRLLFVRRVRVGFTLIEVMIVVMIVGVLLGIAAPNFRRARETSRAKTCSKNLANIQAAMEQWALENRKAQGTNVTEPDLIAGPAPYLRRAPRCPSGGVYDIGSVGEAPWCSRGANGPGAHDDHQLP